MMHIVMHAVGGFGSTKSALSEISERRGECYSEIEVALCRDSLGRYQRNLMV
jgi:hypothetical protein